jgi:hypothetical protein
MGGLSCYIGSLLVLVTGSSSHRPPRISNPTSLARFVPVDGTGFVLRAIPVLGTYTGYKYIYGKLQYGIQYSAEESHRYYRYATGYRYRYK